MKRYLAAAMFGLLAWQAAWAGDAVYSRSVNGEFDSIHAAVGAALEEARFFVIFEANIGANLARNAERWGEDYNRNGFEEVRSLVICNPWYANQVLNLDPDMMALCPMTVTLLYRRGSARILFERLTPPAAGSPAEDVLWEVENTITSALDGVMTK